MNNPIQEINEKASTLTVEDIDRISLDLLEYFSTRIISLSRYTYESESDIAFSSFKEEAKERLKQGLTTFLIKSQHWRTGRDIEPYLLTCLTNLSRGLRIANSPGKKVLIPVCPACKTLNEKEFLHYENKLLRCPTCTKESDRLNSIKKRSSHEEFQFRIRKIFSLHSRKGHRCPSCERFIPDSFIYSSKNGRISCPYDDNCFWFGLISELEPMIHPVSLSFEFNLSLDENYLKTSNYYKNVINANVITPDVIIEQSQEYCKELNIIKDVLKNQKSRLNKNNYKSIKKYLMYEAFENLTNQDPAGMINYLIHSKCKGDRPIQSLIFQKYIKLMENNIPFKISGPEGVTEVFSLLDSNLNLFLGMSEYQAYVKENRVVPNNTHEIFVGVKCNGPCFIGHLCDILDENNKSLLSEVLYYTFSSIKMSNNVPKDTLVKVIHMRIPPHYEMYSLVNLQRVRRKIVDSIYKRINGETRPLKGS